MNVRTSIYEVPAKPRTCMVTRECVYRRELDKLCDDPRCNKGNSDSACHAMSNKDLIPLLSAIP